MRFVTKGLFALALAAIFSTTASAALITGSVSTPGAVNLTTEGAVDWIHWGRSTPTDVTRKASGGSKISNHTLIGAGSTRARMTVSPSTYSWSDGTPTPVVNNIQNGVYINNFNGPGRGFQFTAPADSIERILDVFVGAFDASGTLEATLSDGSALPFTHTLVGATGQTVQAHYTLNYAANSPGQTLTVKWIESADLGGADNVTLQAAALSLAAEVPEPATLSMLCAGVIVLGLRRRK
jgi:hypothetical protein